MPPAPFPDIVPAAFQQPGIGPGDTQVSEELHRYQVQLEPPGPQRLFRLESEAMLQKRMIEESREQTPPDRIFFPKEPVVSTQVYNPYLRNQTWPMIGTIVEPNYVCHGRLLFEQRNAERYGWDFGPAHPLLSAMVFVKDVVTLPYHVGTAPCRPFECSAGLCLPGDPVPLMLYPPEMSVSGLATEAAAVALMFALFP
jgi:hypothetical protein